MAQPTTYNPAHEFLADEAANPNFPGSELDIELNALETTLDEICANLALIQRADGALANGVVTVDSLDDIVLAALADANAAAALAALIAQGEAAFATATSETSLTIGTGAKTLTTAAGKNWTTGTRLRLASDDATKIMDGDVTSYSGTTLVMTVNYAKGTGTHADWNISVVGALGAGPDVAATANLFCDAVIEGVLHFTQPSFLGLLDIETGAVPAFYGNGGAVARFEVDIYGRILGVSEQQINNLAGNAWPATDLIDRVPYVASLHTIAWAEMTGTDKAVFSNSPVLITPNIGAAVAQSTKFAGSTSGYRTLKAPAVAGADADFFFPAGGAGGTFALESYVDAAVATKAALALSVQNSGNTNDSGTGSGAYFAHNKSYTIPANYMTAGRALRILAHFRLTTGSAPPGLDLQLKIGGVVVAHVGSNVPAGSITNRQYAMQFYFQALAAPGASVNTETVALCQLNASGLGAAGACSDTAQPVALATNGTLAITLESRWSAPGTGTNQITLSQLIVEPIGA